MNNTNLQHINALPRDVADNLVFIVEVPSEHLCGLVHRVLNLDGHTTTRLRLFDHLIKGVS